MQKSNIEWCDYTWNPVTGCLHGCPYCYARRITARFTPAEKDNWDDCTQPGNGLHEIRRRNSNGGPWKYGFAPTLHSCRFPEPQQHKKPAVIFVVSMGDLFGEWVPQEWITDVFAACEKAPQHVYIFLTKNPLRYEALALNGKLPTGPNFWFGSTVTRPDMTAWHRSGYHSFLSIEPIFGSFDDAPPDFFNRFQWIIIGAQTGPGSAEHQPRPSWIEDIYDKCRDAHTPVFMKNSLETLWPPFPDMPQEWPESMTEYIGPKKGGS